MLLGLFWDERGHESSGSASSGYSSFGEYHRKKKGLGQAGVFFFGLGVDEVEMKTTSSSRESLLLTECVYRILGK